MAANLISIANVAGKNDIVFTSAVTMAFPIDGITLLAIPTKKVGSTDCVTQVTLISTGDVYYTSTIASSLYSTQFYTGSSKFSFTTTIAAENGNAFESAAIMGFPSMGVILETINSTTFGTTICVTKITLIATKDAYFSSESLATIAGRTA